MISYKYPEVAKNGLSIPLLFALIAAGLAGNYFNFSIFLNIDFVFGSIFALLALQFLGLGRGIAAAAIIAAYTYFLWNHPYSIIIMTAEVAVVGRLMARCKTGMVLSDLTFWLIIGMPLGYLFHHIVMQIPLGSSYVIITKQAVNGIFNALAARLIFSGYLLKSRRQLISYSEIIYNLLAFFVLCPALIMLAVESRKDASAIDLTVRTSLIKNNQKMAQRLQTWVLNRKSSIINLAGMAALKSPQQMQSYLDLVLKSDISFIRVVLVNKEAIATAASPLIDERGQSSINKNYSDRPYLPMLKQRLKPMLSDIVTDKIGAPIPVVMVLAPIVNRGVFGGYVAGILKMDQINEYLEKGVDDLSSLYTLVDKNGNIIMTNRIDQKVSSPLERGKGTFNYFENQTSQWIPDLPANTSVTERWNRSTYISETSVGDLAEWKLILEQPVAPFQKRLYDRYTGKLTLLLVILMVALALAELLSRKLVITLDKLRSLTYELPVRLATDGKAIAWPESGITEAQHLINNFKNMAVSLSDQFIEVRQINESLEERVEERTAALAKSEESYRIVADFAYDWEYWLAADRNLRYISPSCFIHTGYTSEDFLRDSKLLDKIIHPDDRKEFFSHIPSDDNPSKKPEQHRMDFRISTRSGEERWFAHICQPVYSSNGEYLGQRASNRDITESKRINDELILSKRGAEAANIAKSRFLANMSHEIRTPMNSVLGMAQLLEMTTLSDEQRNYVNSLKISGNNMISLISDILDLSKIEAEKIVLEKLDFDLRAETVNCTHQFIFSAEEQGLELTLQIDPDVPLHLNGDSKRLCQILTNLVGNAIKFTNNGSVVLQISKESEAERRATLRFLVKDSGIGISADKLKKIFEPFTQADTSTTRKYGGTGLGLAISKHLAILMGGDIFVESVVGEGSTFWFTLTFDKQMISTIPASPLTLVESKAAGRRLGERLLLVEDDEPTQLVTRIILEKSGYEVEIAANGQEALDLLEQNDYALVLMDCMMPEVNGYEATTAIRSQTSKVRDHNIPVIALTADAFKENSDKCLAAGMNDYLAKPFEITNLLAKLDKWISEKEKGRVAEVTEKFQEHIASNKVKSTDEQLQVLFEVFNRDEFVRRNIGDLALSCDVADIFINSAPEYIDAIRVAISSVNADDLIHSAHKLKGAAANLALPQLAETARMIEAYAKENDLKKAADLLPELEQRLEQAQATIRELLLEPQESANQ